MALDRFQRAAEIRRLREEGQTHKAIAARFGISPSRVSHILRAPPRRMAREKVQAPPTFDERFQRAAEIRRLREEGQTLGAVAARFDITPCRVRQILKRPPRRSGRQLLAERLERLGREAADK